MPVDKRYLVYLASNSQGLDLERYEVQRQLARHGMVNVGFACREDAGPYDWNLVRSQIESADLFILLLGDDYGPMAPTGISYLHREFVHAKSLNKPTLAFIKNTLPEKNLTEAQRRLPGFHRSVAQQSPMLVLGPGWVPAGAGKVAEMPIAAEPAKETAEPLSARQRLARSRQVVNLQIAAKVYQGGNLSQEEVLLPVRLDQLLQGVMPLLKSGASEDRLRAQLEGVVAGTVKSQLLKRNTQAHAVDDIRISRGQFQQILRQWQSLGFVTVSGEGVRALWKALADVAKA